MGFFHNEKAYCLTCYSDSDTPKPNPFSELFKGVNVAVKHIRQDKQATKENGNANVNTAPVFRCVEFKRFVKPCGEFV